MKKTKRISMGVLAAVIAVTPIIAVSCGDDSKREGGSKTSSNKKRNTKANK